MNGDQAFDIFVRFMTVTLVVLVAVVTWFGWTSWHLAQDRCEARGADWRAPGVCSDGVRRIIEVKP